MCAQVTERICRCLSQAILDCGIADTFSVSDELVAHFINLRASLRCSHIRTSVSINRICARQNRLRPNLRQRSAMSTGGEKNVYGNVCQSQTPSAWTDTIMQVANRIDRICCRRFIDTFGGLYTRLHTHSPNKKRTHKISRPATMNGCLARDRKLAAKPGPARPGGGQSIAHRVCWFGS